MEANVKDIKFTICFVTTLKLKKRQHNKTKCNYLIKLKIKTPPTQKPLFYKMSIEIKLCHQSYKCPVNSIKIL